MKKLLLPLAIALLLALAVPAAFATAELGIGGTPGQIAGGASDASPLIDFHVGWSWTILYLSWDSYAMPDYWVYNATSGDFYVPGFLNLFDAGIKLTLKPFVAYLEVGTDYLYLRGGNTYPNMGVNARLGLGLRFGWWGLDLSGTQVFANFDDMGTAFQQAFNGNTTMLLNGLVPTLTFNIYF